MRLYVIILAVFLCGCGKSGKVVTSVMGDGGDVTVFDFTQTRSEGADSILHEERLNLSSLAEEVRIVKLETGDECLVGRRANYFVGNTFIIVSQDDRMMLFDQDGRFRRVIALKGRGPREFGQVDDFTVNEESGLVYILEYDNIKIFSLSDSSYFRQVPCAEREVIHNCVLPLDNGRLLLTPYVYKRAGHLVYAQDTVGRLLGGTPCPPNEANPHFVVGEKLTYRVGDELRYLSGNRDSVFRVDTGGILNLKWVFKAKMGQELRMNGETPGLLLVTVLTVLEKEVMPGSVQTSYSHCYYLYDKNQKRLITYGSMLDDYLEMPISNHELNRHNRGRFCIEYSASMLMEVIPQILTRKDLKPEVRERLEDLQKTCAQDDNPVLLTGRLR